MYSWASKTTILNENRNLTVKATEFVNDREKISRITLLIINTKLIPVLFPLVSRSFATEFRQNKKSKYIHKVPTKTSVQVLSWYIPAIILVELGGELGLFRRF